jgi:hypothetical protein
VPLHRAEDGDVERLHDVSGILWQEDVADVMLGAEIQHGRRHVGAEVVTDKDLYLVFRKGVDVRQ